jgi:hypothetical protein
MRLTLWREWGRKAHRSATRRRGAGSLRSARRLQAGARCQTTASLKGSRPLARLAGGARFAACAHARAVGRRLQRGMPRCGSLRSASRGGAGAQGVRGVRSRAYLAARNSSS